MNPGTKIVNCLAILLLASGSLQAKLQQPQWKWWALNAAGEGVQYLDNDGFLFKDAMGRTASLYAAFGRDQSYLSLGFNDFRLIQDNWDFHSRRALVHLWQQNSSGIGLGLHGFRSQADDEFEGWGLGAEVAVPFLQRNTRYFLSGSSQRHATFIQDTGQAPLEQRLIENGLHWQNDGAALQLRWLAQMRKDLISHAFFLKAQGTLWDKTQLTVKALQGRQPFWFDADDLVLHDSGSALRAFFSFKVAHKIRQNMSLQLSTGWEKTDNHESRWLYFGLQIRGGQWILQ